MPTGGSRLSSQHGASIEPRANEPVLRVFDDPLVYELFGVIATRVVETTPLSMSDYTGAAPADVRRRLAVLEHANLIEPVKEGTAGQEPAYRPTRDALITDEEYAQFQPAHRRRLVRNVLRHADTRIWSALERGGFDVPDAHLSWTPLDLDRQGYEDMVGLALGTVERARDIQAEVVERRVAGTSEEGGAYTDLMVLHFRRDDGRPSTATGDGVARLRKQIYALSEEIMDAVTVPAPDTNRLAACARELAGLLDRLGVATR